MPVITPKADCAPCRAFAVAEKHSLLGREKLKRLRHIAKSTARVPGDVAELGVYKGGAAFLLAAELPQKTIHLFDTFEGIPTKGANDVHGVGDFRDTSLASVRALLDPFENVRFHPGFFPATADGLAAETFAFVHIDADQEQSTRDALAYFWPRMSEGGIILFDDYEWQNCPGVKIAVDEFARSVAAPVERPGPHQAYIKKTAPVAVSGPLRLSVSATGIGDAICGYYAACGAANAGYEVEYSTKHPGWFSRVAHPGVRVLPHGESGIDLSARYHEQLREADCRKQWYCDNLRIALQDGRKIVPAAPASVDREIRTRQLEFSNYVLIAPYSAYPSRNWPLSHWNYLIHLLHQARVSVAILDKPGGEERCSRDFPGVTQFVGRPMDDVADAMLGARAVVGLDSGMTHFAGMLGAKAIAIMAHLPPAMVFAKTEVMGLIPDTSCSLCRWQKSRGYAPSCRAACSAMATIAPQKVVKVVLG